MLSLRSNQKTVPILTINFPVNKCSMQPDVAKGTRIPTDTNIVPSEESTTEWNMHLLCARDTRIILYV